MRISWYYFKLSAIYRIKNNAWLWVLLKRNLHLRFAPDRAVSAIFALCLHMILCDIFCIVPYGVAFGNFYLMEPWMILLCFLCWLQNRMGSDNFRVLGNVVWLLVQDISELDWGYENSNVLISTTNCPVGYNSPGSIFLILIFHFWAPKLRFLIFWNLLAWGKTFIF